MRRRGSNNKDTFTGGVGLKEEKDNTMAEVFRRQQRALLSRLYLFLLPHPRGKENQDHPRRK